jgi:hypothetical protein
VIQVSDIFIIRFGNFILFLSAFKSNRRDEMWGEVLGLEELGAWVELS